MHLIVHTKVRALMGLVALAASLAGCGGSGGTVTSVDNEVVTVPTLARVRADVAASGLTALDKNRFAAFVDDHQDQTNAYADKTVREVIDLQISYEGALRMTAQANADDKRHKAILAKLIAPTIALASEDDRKIVLHVAFRNLSRKAIKKLDLGLEFDDPKTGAPIAMAEVRVTRDIPGRGRIAFDYPMRYYRFSEDAGPLMASKGKPKTLKAQVKEIRYADGTDAGFDD